MGKYVGKYETGNDEACNIHKATMLSNIANELAESNRLKRLEMEYNDTENRMNPEEWRVYMDKLEDKA